MEPRTSPADPPAAGSRTRSARERGQGLVMFVGAIVFFIGFMAIVVDVTWYWMNTLKVQRAADAAALAGAVWLPDQPAKAQTVAFAEATKNGYTTGIGGVTVTAAQNPTRDIQLDTRVTAPVTTFFMRLFGINTITASRNAAAEYVLPVPMGSPLNYFGAFGALRGWIHMDSGWRYPTTTRVGAGVPDMWTTPNYAYADESPNPALYSTVGNTTDYQGFTVFRIPGSSQANFGMPAAPANARFQQDGGVEVQVKARSSLASGCQLQAQVSPNSGLGAGASWAGGTTAIGNPANLTATDTVYTFGGHASTSSTDVGNWFGRTTWSATDFSDANFAVQLKALGAGGCSAATTYVDYVRVRVTYEQQSPLITGPNGEPLNQQGVWATVNAQGSDVVNGDAYSSQYNGSGSNTQYSPTSYYDYAVEFQPGTTGGSVYVFDPVFCATNSNGSQGMGDRWFSGSNPMSTFYDIYDTNNTPYDLTDDTWLAGNTGPTGASNPLYGLFRRSRGSDPSQGGPPANSPITNCQYGKVTDPTQGGYWHNRWWNITNGTTLAGPVGSTPRVYRIRVTSTDLAAPSDQSSTNGQNSFSFFATVAGHTCPTTPIDPACPRVYGLGAMQAFSPLSPSTSADLYLAQIGAVYAGKTMKVTLWDPGDTGSLTAVLSFLMPATTGYVTAPLTWTATKFATGGYNCNGSSPGTVTSITTSNGGAMGLFNGCWVVINIAVPTTYTAPTPPGEPGGGWWKIRYTMGSGSSSAFDVTTWKTQLVGNPVHLVTP